MSGPRVEEWRTDQHPLPSRAVPRAIGASNNLSSLLALQGAPRHNVIVWRSTAAVMGFAVFGGLAGCSETPSGEPGPCLEVGSSIVEEIERHAQPEFALSDFVAVKAESTEFEQLFYISARATRPGEAIATATWASDDISVVRRGPLPSKEPIILAANGIARAATPTLRTNGNSEVRRPGANSASKASQACVRSAI